MARPVIVRVATAEGLTCILIWSGTTGSIPSSWQLCDGTGGTLDLRDQFVRGTQYADDYYQDGSTDGDWRHRHNGGYTADNESAHTHVLSGVVTQSEDGYDGGGAFAPLIGAAHSHTIPDTQTTATATHNHTASITSWVGSSDASTLPPYYALCWIQGSVTSMPVGGIVAYSGASTSIPSTYAICDGTLGTPNLRNLFVPGAGDTYAVGATGGTNGLSTTAFAHSHGLGTLALNNESTHTHIHSAAPLWVDYTAYTTQGAASHLNILPISAPEDPHRHEVTNKVTEAGTAHTHTLSTGSQTLHFGNAYNTPPHWALSYLMRRS